MRVVVMYWIMPLLTRILLAILLLSYCCRAFTTSSLFGHGTVVVLQEHQFRLNANQEKGQSSSSSSSSSLSVVGGDDDDDTYEEDTSWLAWANESGLVLSPKVSVRRPLPEQRGKGGVVAQESISALEVLLRVPREMIISDCDMPEMATEAAAQATKFSWATDLTAATLYDLHHTGDDEEDEEEANNQNGKADDDIQTSATTKKRDWIASWKEGGWATLGEDLGPPEVQWGAKSVTGSLMATGSDNDHNVYAKFRFPCHPVVHRAAIGLALLTGAEEEEARTVLLCRGRMYRSMRDALLPLVKSPLAERTSGSQRERRVWEIADVLSRVLSRATTLQLEEDKSTSTATGENGIMNYCVVPLHERLAHSVQGLENTKLISSPSDGSEILLIATRDISKGEELTRDYTMAPQLEEDTSQGALRLLSQFGLPPKAWPPVASSSSSSSSSEEEESSSSSSDES